MPLEIREKELKVHKKLENVIMRIRCQETIHSASKNDDFQNMPMTYIDGKELLNQFFEDNEQWEE